jgi:hypothetical protein
LPPKPYELLDAQAGQVAGAESLTRHSKSDEQMQLAHSTRQSEMASEMQVFRHQPLLQCFWRTSRKPTKFMNDL